MIKTAYILIFIFFFCSHLCGSQEISGKVKDWESGDFIQFVNIGIVGTDIGTISGMDGTFSLDIPKQSIEIRFGSHLWDMNL